MVDTKDFSTILSGLLNDFPAIGAREIRFGELGDKSGVGIYPSAAATVISETTDIMGGVYQKCNYAVQVVYRAVPQSETDRIHIKGWLDKLARWLEKQPITADGQQHTLAAWPNLGDGRTITAFVQVSAAYLAGRYADGVEDWAVSLSMRYDRGNLISAFAPIYNYILPAIRTLLAWLAKLTAVVSVFINSLFGKTASQADASAKALYNQASATEAAGDAAEKAKKQLSGLDEMNRWESNDSSGGGGGGGSSGAAPKFDLSDQVDTGKIGKIAAVVRELSPYVAAVAAGFAAWKIGKKFLGNLSKAKQLALAVAGAVLMAINVVDMLKNGINFDNLTGYIIGAAAAVTGLGMAFGVLGGAITAIVAGLVLLGVAIRDVIKNGFNNKNLTAITVALLTIGGAIAIITGAWIPLLIAAIAAVVVWIVAKWTSIKEWISKTISSIDAAFEQHLANVEAGAAAAVDWLIAKWTAVKDWFRGLWEKVSSGAVAAWDGIKSAFKSVPEWFQSKFRDAWQKVKDVFSTGGRIWSGIKEGIESTFRTVVNAIIRGMNTIIAVPFNRINFMLNTIRNAHFLGISPFQNLWGVNPLPVPQIPMLARGAVIPANRQFLAVLGDQRNGNNLEAPESLLRQIVREEAGSAGSRYEFIARLDRRTLFDEVITEAKLRKGQTGKNPLVAV